MFQAGCKHRLAHVKTAVDPLENPSPESGGSQGFTLFEMLVVMLIIVLSMGAVSTLYRSPSGRTEVKAVALVAASRLRDLRSSAMSTHSERVARIDTVTRMIRFNDGRAPLKLKNTIVMTVTAADSEKSSPSTMGIRFYPNGSSSGATIALKSQRQSYEIRINWLTGRVSTSAL